MGRGISFLLFSKQILDFFSYNQILGFFFYFANADIRFLFLHFANSPTQLSCSPHVFTKNELSKMKNERNKEFFMIALCHNGLKLLIHIFLHIKNLHFQNKFHPSYPWKLLDVSLIFHFLEIF